MQMPWKYLLLTFVSNVSKLEQCNFMPIFVILNYRIHSFTASVLIFPSPYCLPQFSLIQIMSLHIAEMSQR